MPATSPSRQQALHLLVGVWVLALLVSLPFFLFSLGQYEKEVTQRLENLADYKEEALQNWIQQMDVALLRLARLPKITAAVTQPYDLTPDPSSVFNQHHFLNETLESYLSPFGPFLEVFMLDSAGQVVYSSDPEQLGKNKASRRYFIQGQHTAYIQNIYHSVTLRSAAMTLARPLHLQQPDGSQEFKIGVIAARADLSKLNRLMAAGDSSSQTQIRSYLVNKYNFFITPPNPDEAADFTYPRPTHTRGVHACLQNRPLQGVYLDHRGVRVRGTARWLPQHQLCLLVEEDYTSRYQVFGQQFLGVFLLLIPLSLVIWWLAPRLGYLQEERKYQPGQVDTRFLSLLGHEIRTPLNGIIGMLALLQEGRLDPEQRQQARVADASAQQLLNLLKYLIARARQGNHPVKDQTEALHWQDINESLEMLLRSFTRSADHKGLKLHFLPAPQLRSREVQANLTLLLQLASNLIENAVKFTESGSVTLGLKARLLPGNQEVEIQMSVADTGPGIAETDQKKIFQPFHRLNNQQKSPATSLGLGLAISSELSEQLQGHLALQSTPGQGSCFTLTFVAPVRRAVKTSQ
ncbi:sensor histidine kinase [Marinospirillum perlucidum]|uniref:sensor histidine kinase n=1 Tax=Marinospirillum perlucidum TaxID=1982602 RepID=UPI000DF217B2|nr:sensor histidine kinase [Marinospirillum perlucidum]